MHDNPEGRPPFLCDLRVRKIHFTQSSLSAQRVYSITIASTSTNRNEDSTSVNAASPRDFETSGTRAKRFTLLPITVIRLRYSSGRQTDYQVFTLLAKRVKPSTTCPFCESPAAVSSQWNSDTSVDLPEEARSPSVSPQRTSRSRPDPLDRGR